LLEGKLVNMRVMEKAGFKEEGTMRKCFFSRGEFRDAHLYSILREEWEEPKDIDKNALKKLG
jgi:RimJ/RimL family protein N-acetyltransferase